MSEKQTIISLTPAAVSHVKNILAREQTALGLRVSIKKRGCSGYAYVMEILKDQPKATDQSVQQDGLTIFIDSNAINYINGTTLDYVNKGFGHEEWTFQNPNVESLCGCGESFNVKEQQNDSV